MRYLTLAAVVWLQGRLIATSGGTPGLRDLGRVEAALAQPRATFDGADLYPDIVSKAAALCHGLVCGHAFVDGNKRIGHAAMEMFLSLNDAQLRGDVDDHERTILALASGTMSRETLERWLRAQVHLGPA